MLDQAALRKRFALVEIDDEGVLLDGESGVVFRVNATAREIWARALAGNTPAAIVDSMVQRFGISPDLAKRDVESALAERPATESVHARGGFGANQCRWEETPAGYSFLDHGVVCCVVEREGTHLRLVRSAGMTEGVAHARIRSAVPRLLALRGIRVLHASAVEIEGTLTVFTGRSGAGKTTTARAVAEHGARLVSEDLLVLARTSQRPRAMIDGEMTIRRWIAQQANLALSNEQAIRCDELDRCVRGEELPIAEILLIDADRRAGDRVQLEPLSKPEALVALLESVYFASSDSLAWRAQFESLRDLVASVVTSRATMPQGIPLLEKAARALHQRQMIAS